MEEEDVIDALLSMESMLVGSEDDVVSTDIGEKSGRWCRRERDLIQQQEDS
jgi:hypothetical protein